jgi:hypothetical protein
MSERKDPLVYGNEEGEAGGFEDTARSGGWRGQPPQGSYYDPGQQSGQGPPPSQQVCFHCPIIAFAAESNQGRHSM